MNERIQRLVHQVLTSDINPPTHEIECDPFDEKLSEPMFVAKRFCEFYNAQPIVIGDDNELVGHIRFDKTPVPADIFHRSGHAKFREVSAKYYGKPQENLCTFEWQHSNADFGKLIRLGLNGYVKEINASRKNSLGERSHLQFLAALERVIHGIGQRADACRQHCVDLAEACENPVRKATLLRMAANCANVPMNPARSFEEAVQCVYFCFAFLPDSIGRPDQYLYPLYKQGIADGTLTPEHATELIQELFIMIHGHTPFNSGWAGDKGAESHFAIGGYTIDHEDGFNELSKLIIEAMMDMPLIRPQVSLRWNKKTPHDVLRYMMDWERKDKNKRIAFVNDEPRIAGLMKLFGLPWEKAYDYIMVGCNEPAFQGGISLGGNTVNIVRSLTNTLTKRRSEILKCKDFDSFYAIYEQELHNDLYTILDYGNMFNDLRSRDCNVLSSLFLDGCIERAESATRGGATLARGGGANFMGTTNLVDSLAVIRQFVFEEKKIAFADLLKALDDDWKGAEDMRQMILSRGRFFGNHDELSDSIARRVYESVYAFAAGRTDIFGTTLTYGNLTGYNQHFAWFGALTGATPDGRVAGSALTFGSGQSYGKDNDGVTSHLLSVAQMDTTGIMTGNTIMNLTVDEQTVRDDASFEKLVLLVETFFKQGGLHIQLNHVSREELIAAKAEPQKYKSLRVRVSGFSATFISLNEALQDNVINRTTESL